MVGSTSGGIGALARLRRPSEVGGEARAAPWRCGRGGGSSACGGGRWCGGGQGRPPYREGMMCADRRGGGRGSRLAARRSLGRRQGGRRPAQGRLCPLRGSPTRSRRRRALSRRWLPYGRRTQTGAKSARPVLAAGFPCHSGDGCAACLSEAGQAATVEEHQHPPVAPQPQAARQPCRQQQAGSQGGGDWGAAGHVSPAASARLTVSAARWAASARSGWPARSNRDAACSKTLRACLLLRPASISPTSISISASPSR